MLKSMRPANRLDLGATRKGDHDRAHAHTCANPSHLSGSFRAAQACFLAILLAAILLACTLRMTARPRRTDRGLRASGRRAHAWALLVAVTLLAAGCGPRQGEFLTTIKQVRDLKPSDADRGYPVRLRGITTYSHAQSRSLIVQVGADAILVVTPSAQTPPPPGREVEIEGITGTGESSAIVVAASVRDLLAAELPVAEAISSKDLSSSRYAYRRVEIEGIVRSFLLDNAQRLTLGVATEDGMVRAQVNVAGPQVPVDSRVRIRGVAASMFDLRGGVIRQQILVRGLSDVVVMEAGAADPFSLPVQSVATLLQIARECGASTSRADTRCIHARRWRPVP